MRVGVIGIVAALLVGLLLAPGAANAAFVVPPAPTPPGPTPTAPDAPGTPAPPSGQAPNDTVPAPSSPEAPASGPAAAPRTPADALRALPFSTLPAVANAVTCYIVVDKVTPTKPVSNVVGQGCHNGPRIPPLLNQLLPGGPGATSPPAPGTTPAPTPAPAPAPRLRSDDGPNGVSAGAPDEAPAAAAQAASVPIAEFYAGANYSGASFIIYGSGGGCDSLGYRLSDLAARNSSIGGASSYRTYNNCSNQAIHNQVDFGGAANFFTGYNRASLPSGYDNAVRSARLASVPCTYYNETNASVCGVIRDKYNALGGPDGPLGFPTSNELTNPDGVGKRSTFQGATSIYWTPATGAHDVRGPLRDAWARNGWETGPLGYPLSDQIAIATGDGRTNRFFKNNTYAAGTPTRNTGAIYWSPATNARALHGPIWDRYSALGGAPSKVGYPTSDQITNSSGRYTTYGSARNDFERGMIFLKQNRGVLASWDLSSPESTSSFSGSAAKPEGSSIAYDAAPQQPPAGNARCPVAPIDTTNPPVGKEPYRCLALVTSRDGAENFVREGRPRAVAGRGAFGHLHALQDHQVGLKAVLTLIFDSGPFQRPVEDPRSVELDRWMHDAILVYEDEPTRPLEGIRASVQRRADITGNSPDPGGLGLVTAFCNDGSPGGPGGAVHPGGVCPRDLPPPFGLATGGA